MWFDGLTTNGYFATNGHDGFLHHLYRCAALGHVVAECGAAVGGGVPEFAGGERVGDGLGCWLCAGCVRQVFPLQFKCRQFAVRVLVLRQLLTGKVCHEPRAVHAVRCAFGRPASGANCI